MKSPAMSPPRKYPIPNQDSTRIVNQKDPILPPLLSKWPTGYKPFLIIHIFQIKQNKNIIILQILHVLRIKIL